MINVLIFTKDRPMQLDLLLTSIRDHLNQDILQIHVLAKLTNKEYEDGYDIIREKYPYVIFHREEGCDFKDRVLGIVGSFIYPWTLCFCDDDVVINYTWVTPVLSRLSDKKINALSLRMWPGIDYCYPKDVKISLPLSFQQIVPNLMCWDWAACDPTLDWGYPMSLAGNVYRQDQLYRTWQQLPFTSPNYIEGCMHQARDIDSPFQICFEEMKVYNVANNLVQTVCGNRYEPRAKHDPEYLNVKFLQGYVLDKLMFYGKEFKSANGPGDYELIKK